MKALFLIVAALIATPTFAASVKVSPVPAVATPVMGVPDFSLSLMNGNRGTYSTAAHDSAFLLDFYFNSCPACNENAPAVEEVAAEFHSNQIQFLAIGIDRNDSDYASWIRKHNPSFPVLKDNQRTLPPVFGVSSYPTTVILDCNMNEVFRYVGTWNARKKQEIKDKLFDLMFQICR